MDAHELPGAHCAVDDLALIALGEPAPAGFDLLHLSSCEHCRNELDALRGVVLTGRSATAADRPVAPPPTIWEGVAAAVREDRAAGIGELRRTHPRRTHTRFTVQRVTAVAAALVLVVAGLAVTVGPFRDRGGSTEVTTVALGPVGSATAHGDAVMTASPDGSTMTVDVPDLPTASGGFFEVWLMASPTELVSLGVLDSKHHGTFPVPDGLDVKRYPYVDVSLEAFDGNPAHSGDSVVRGRLPA